MTRVTWKLAPYAGKTGRIRIVDEASGGWGHINVDQIVQSDTPAENPADAVCTREIAITGKYMDVHDAYASIDAALAHCGARLNAKLDVLAATLRSGICASICSRVSVRPSEKYSLPFFHCRTCEKCKKPICCNNSPLSGITDDKQMLHILSGAAAEML